MTVALFDPRVRWLLAAVAVLGMAMAAIARRRGAPRLVTIGLCATFGALGVLAAEAMVALTVRLAAPGSACTLHLQTGAAHLFDAASGMRIAA